MRGVLLNEFTTLQSRYGTQGTGERSGKLISNHCFKIHCNFLLVLSWNEFLSSTTNFPLLFPLLVRRRLVRLKEDLKLVSGSFFY